MIRKHVKPLEQVVIRYQELVTFSTEPPMSVFISNTIEFKNLRIMDHWLITM